MVKIKCKLCKEIIWSEYTHDFRSCKCGAIAIDGGNDYTRIINPEKAIILKEKKYGNKK